MIAGRWCAAQGPTFSPLDATTGQALDPPFHVAGKGEVDLAVQAAVEAFEQSRRLAPAWGSRLLEAIAERIMDLGDALLARAHAETALPIRPRLEAERTRTCNQLRLFAELAREGSWVEAVIETAQPAAAGRQPVPKPDLRRMYQPIGPIAVFDASNFPFAFGPCGGDTASALAAGNPVVVKAHWAHPGTDELFAAAALAALRELDLPAGLFSLLHGPGAEAGACLATHPGVEAVAFTGSRAAGRALFNLAAARPKPIPVFAEMGSLNPLVILPGALSERGAAIARELAGSITLGVGQFCTKPGIICALESASLSAFADALCAALAAAPPAVMLNPPLRKAFLEGVEKLATASHVHTRLRSSGSGPTPVAAALFEVDAADWLLHPEWQEEIFGPAAILVRCGTLDQVRRVIQSIGGSLTGTLHVGAGDDPKVVLEILHRLEGVSGRVIVNGYPTGVEVCGAMSHGGPYPATTAPASTSVGTLAIRRFVRPVCYQNVPDDYLPPALRNANPLGIVRQVDGRSTKDPLEKEAVET